MDKFFSDLEKKRKPVEPEGKASLDADAPSKKSLPKGVVLGKDGKPYTFPSVPFEVLRTDPVADVALAPPSPPGRKWRRKQHPPNLNPTAQRPPKHPSPCPRTAHPTSKL